MAIQFAAYRHFEASRIATNDAAMALVVGLRLGGVALSSVSEGECGRHLPELFVEVPDIQRLNRTVEDAGVLLQRAERYVAYMGIPFVLSVYQTLTVEAAQLLRRDGKDTNTEDPSLIKLERIHDYLMNECGLPLPPMEVEMFDFVRQVRNRILHFEGVPGSNLRAAYMDLPTKARELWETWTGRPFTDAISDLRRPMDLTARELTPVLALTKRLSKAINGELSRGISRRLWAELVVEDYKDLEPERFQQRGMRLRKVRGLARHLYGDLALTDDELQETLRAHD